MSTASKLAILAMSLSVAFACAQYGRAASKSSHHSAGASSVSFTARQVSAGRANFARSCAQCHGANLQGGAGPALSGPTFKTLSSKVHANVSDVFGYMTSNMPMNAPASLSHDQYVAIMAYILSKNGYKAGNSALTYGGATSSTARIVK